MVQNVLFVCSQNWHRSKTAETLFSNNTQFNVKSAGTNSYAETPLTEEILQWADIVLVMESHHKKNILTKFSDSIAEDKIIVLDIPDRYRYMDPELITNIKTKTKQIL